MATINGAKALKMKVKIGELKCGWQGDIIAIKIPHGKGRVIERILSDESRNVFTMVAGKVCYKLDSSAD